MVRTLFRQLFVWLSMDFFSLWYWTADFKEVWLSCIAHALYWRFFLQYDVKFSRNMWIYLDQGPYPPVFSPDYKSLGRYLTHITGRKNSEENFPWYSRFCGKIRPFLPFFIHFLWKYDDWRWSKIWKSRSIPPNFFCWFSFQMIQWTLERSIKKFCRKFLKLVFPSKCA